MGRRYSHPLRMTQQSRSPHFAPLPPPHPPPPQSNPAGRTGRAGKTGVATTFINKSVDEHLLLDLKHLLIEAKQRVPPVLLALEDPADLHSNDGELGAGCAYW
jgi:hypothetical protein